MQKQITETINENPAAGVISSWYKNFPSIYFASEKIGGSYFNYADSQYWSSSDDNSRGMSFPYFLDVDDTSTGIGFGWGDSLHNVRPVMEF